LRDRVRRNGGRVHRHGPTHLLLIDLKSEAEPTYRRLREVLADYREILTVFRSDRTVTNALTVIVSGNRPRQMLLAEPERLAALDGRLDDLGQGVSSHVMPLISDRWSREFLWDGIGPMPVKERDRLAALVSQTQAEGKVLRFWAVPDRPEAWEVLLRAGVDLINTDRLADLRRFLDAQPDRATPVRPD
jgi:hypothetical protein